MTFPITDSSLEQKARQAWNKFIMARRAGKLAFPPPPSVMISAFREKQSEEVWRGFMKKID
ncbi:hypothetical protein [Gluconacetobacter diazotrophicus]|uniref:hypothetical protein n=1 Tax=Gluconacetobacter diazotrophicus TaxID=33996 RepID=UPI0011A50D0E|nr:hypothetical protein [Gluconacetobacter diazotrophicus]